MKPKTSFTIRELDRETWMKFRMRAMKLEITANEFIKQLIYREVKKGENDVLQPQG